MNEIKRKYYQDLEYLGNAESYLDDILECVNNIKLFEGFNEDEIKAICHFMECYAAPRGYELLKEGAQGDFLLLILTGSVSVVKTIPAQGEKEIAEVGPGGSIGELCLIDGRPRFASCFATLPTDFAVFTRDSLNELLIHYPRLASKFLLLLLQIMTVRMRETSDRFLPIVYSSAP